MSQRCMELMHAIQSNGELSWLPQCRVRSGSTSKHHFYWLSRGSRPRGFLEKGRMDASPQRVKGGLAFPSRIQINLVQVLRRDQLVLDRLDLLEPGVCSGDGSSHGCRSSRAREDAGLVCSFWSQERRIIACGNLESSALL
jgi:hypothetical protein